MSENLWLYNKYREVPTEALKAFDNGTFKGTDINTMWRIKCLTEEFGPCGIGWYYDIIKLWEIEGKNGELLCFAEIKLYFKYQEQWSKGISATGGSKLVSYVQSKQYHKNSDEGYKMALTDALGVACKYLGFGANTYWANDKSKYTAFSTDENEGEGNKVQPIKQTHQTEPKKAVKTDDKAKAFQPLTKSELVEIWGVSAPEKTIIWLEGQLGKELASFDEEDTAWARAQLEAGKKKREEKERQAKLERISDDDIPFPMGD
jgi:hypothetical protein